MDEANDCVGLWTGVMLTTIVAAVVAGIVGCVSASAVANHAKAKMALAEMEAEHHRNVGAELCDLMRYTLAGMARGADGRPALVFTDRDIELIAERAAELRQRAFDPIFGGDADRLAREGRL